MSVLTLSQHKPSAAVWWKWILGSSFISLLNFLLRHFPAAFTSLCLWFCTHPAHASVRTQGTSSTWISTDEWALHFPYTLPTCQHLWLKSKNEQLRVHLYAFTLSQVRNKRTRLQTCDFAADWAGFLDLAIQREDSSKTSRGWGDTAQVQPPCTAWSGTDFYLVHVAFCVKTGYDEQSAVVLQTQRAIRKKSKWKS